MNGFLFVRTRVRDLNFANFSVRNFIVDVNMTWRMFLESNFSNFCKSRFVASSDFFLCNCDRGKDLFSLSRLRVEESLLFLRGYAKNLSLEASFVRSDESCNY